MRDCGYVEDPAHDNRECFSRPGSHDIEVTHCSCTTDMCNRTSVSAGPQWLLLLLLLCTTAVAAVLRN